MIRCSGNWKKKNNAIVRLDIGEQLIHTAEAFIKGGISVIEFTFSTPGALDMVKEASAHFGDEVLLGAGIVLDTETARAAVSAGAQFVVTPYIGAHTRESIERMGVMAAENVLDLQGNELHHRVI